MKRGELHHDGHVSFLTYRASDGAEATAGDSGWRRSRFRACKGESSCTALGLSAGFSDFEPFRWRVCYV